jgi:hypothetical protein
MTGHYLLELLQSLSEEELDLPVVSSDDPYDGFNFFVEEVGVGDVADFDGPNETTGPFIVMLQEGGEKVKNVNTWEDEGYVKKGNGLLEKELVKKLVHDDSCSLWFSLYHVGNAAGYDEWPDGSWYELEIYNCANAAGAISNRMRIDLRRNDMDNILEFIMEAKPILKKCQEELAEMRAQ